MSQFPSQLLSSRHGPIYLHSMCLQWMMHLLTFHFTLLKDISFEPWWEKIGPNIFHWLLCFVLNIGFIWKSALYHWCSRAPLTDWQNWAWAYTGPQKLSFNYFQWKQSDTNTVVTLMVEQYLHSKSSLHFKEEVQSHRQLQGRHEILVLFCCLLLLDVERGYLLYNKILVLLWFLLDS